MNPFKPLYDACNAPKDELIDFPRIIDLEVTNTCNFRCVMCPTGNRSMKRPSGFMNYGTFVRVVEQCDGCHGIRFIGWGEPLLHPDIVRFVCFANQHDILTHLNTNASKLDLRMAEDLVDAGLSSIKFSFQGADKESYQQMRKTDFFEGMVRAIEKMHQARGHRKFPYISASTSLTDESPQIVEKFRERLEPLVDSLTIGRTIFGFMDLQVARLSEEEKQRIEPMIEWERANLRHPDPCPEVFDKLTIQWDGSVRVCCNDYNGLTNLGNVMTSPLRDIWRHKQIEEYRARLRKKDYDAPLCKDCWQYI